MTSDVGEHLRAARRISIRAHGQEHHVVAFIGQRGAVEAAMEGDEMPRRDTAPGTDYPNGMQPVRRPVRSEALEVRCSRMLLASAPARCHAFVMRRLLCLAFGILAACSSETLAPLPLAVSIEASRTTAAPGDSISFEVIAQGGQLIGITTAYGDGTGDQFATSGARTARVTFRHAFPAPGTYQVRATVTDALAGEKEASIEIRVE